MNPLICDLFPFLLLCPGSPNALREDLSVRRPSKKEAPLTGYPEGVGPVGLGATRQIEGLARGAQRPSRSARLPKGNEAQTKGDAKERCQLNGATRCVDLRPAPPQVGRRGEAFCPRVF